MLRSEDGGFTWEVALPMPLVPFLVDRLVGWAVLGDRLFQTEDSGRTWKNRSYTIVPFNSLQHVVFADRRRGILVGYPVSETTNEPVALYTTDEGEHWSSATVETDFGQGPRINFTAEPAACLTKAGIGLLAWRSCCIQREESSFVVATNNFGARWADVIDRIGVAQQGILGIVRDIACAGDSDLWLVEGETVVGVDPVEGKLLHSGNGGESWERVPGPSLDGEEAIVKAVHFIDPLLGWVATLTTRGLAVFRSADGGHTWEAQYVSDSRDSGVAIDFADPEHGLVSVDSPRRLRNSLPILLVTKNGGDSWQRIELEDSGILGPVSNITIRTDAAVSPGTDDGATE